MIRQVDKSRFNMVWYATDDDAVIGVYTATDMDQSLPTEEDATAALHDAMRSIHAS